MTLKRYIANCSTGYSVNLTLANGKAVRVDFSGNDVLARKRFIDVEDPLIQKALDEHKSNGVYFYASKEQIYSETAPAPSVEEGLEFENAQSAKEWLNKKHGVPLKKMLNKEQTSEQFEALGYTVKYLTD